MQNFTPLTFADLGVLVNKCSDESQDDQYIVAITDAPIPRQKVLLTRFSTADLSKDLPIKLESIGEHIEDAIKREFVITSGTPISHLIQEVGERLFDILFPPDSMALECYERSLDIVRAQRKGLRIKLDIHESLTNFPWEAMRHRGGGPRSIIPYYLALQPDISITRYMGNMWMRYFAPVSFEPPLTILVVTASPNDPDNKYSNISESINKEVSILEEIVNKTSKLFKIVPVKADENSGTLAKLNETLTKTDTPVIGIHYIGHGNYDKNGGFLVGETKQKSMHKIYAQDLLPCLQRQPALRWLVLNACRLAQEPFGNPLAGLATNLSHGAEIPAIIAMKYEIGDRTAIKFAETIYSELLIAKRPIDQAFSKTLYDVYTMSSIEAVTPVLIMKSIQGKILDDLIGDVKVDKDKKPQDDKNEIINLIKDLIFKKDFKAAQSHLKSSKLDNRNYNLLENEIEEAISKFVNEIESQVDEHIKTQKWDLASESVKRIKYIKPDIYQELLHKVEQEKINYQKDRVIDQVRDLINHKEFSKAQSNLKKIKDKLNTNDYNSLNNEIEKAINKFVNEIKSQVEVLIKSQKWELATSEIKQIEALKPEVKKELSLKIKNAQNKSQRIVLVAAGNFTKGLTNDQIEFLVRQFSRWPNLEIESARRSLIEEKHEKAYLDTFYVDKYLVTNEEFEKFIKATNYKTDAEKMGERINWRKLFSRGMEKHPVVFVSWNDAVAYTQWTNKRLLTEDEWKKAARGTDSRIYPWGDDFNAKKCNTAESMQRGAAPTSPVGAFKEDKSPYDCYDMGGNVQEWTATELKGLKVAVGGSWSMSGEVYSIIVLHRVANATYYAEDLGFRCAQDSA